VFKRQPTGSKWSFSSLRPLRTLRLRIYRKVRKERKGKKDHFVAKCYTFPQNSTVAFVSFCNTFSVHSGENDCRETLNMRFALEFKQFGYFWKFFGFLAR
jgi:hypothetical protein